MEADQTKFDILTQLTELIRTNFPKSPKIISNNTSLIRDLDADSLDMVDFILSLEDTFDIEILDEDLEALLTLESLQSYIYAKLRHAAEDC